MRRHLPKLVMAWVLSSLVSVPLSMNLLVGTQLLPRLRAQRAAEFAPHAERMRADLALVAQAPPFAKPKFERNADIEFRAHIDYEREGRLATSPAAALKMIDEKFPRWRTHEEDVRRLLGDPLLAVIDTAWIWRLSAYDHWSPYRDLARLAKLSGLSRAAAFAALPRPDYAQVRDLALVQLLQSATRGDAAGGIARLHQVAALAATAGTQDGHLVAVSLLKLESGFARAFGVKLAPAREDVLEAYGRLAQAWARVARLTQTQDAGFDSYLKFETGACAIAADGVLGLTPYADFLAPRAPYEQNLAADLARDRAFHERLLDTCGLRELKAFWAPVPPPTWWQEGVRTPAGTTRAMPNFARIPYVRRVLGVYLMLQTPEARYVSE